MLIDLHDSLRRLVYERGRIDPADVDVSFEAPTREWTDRVARPTIDIFLFGLEENIDLRRPDYIMAKTNGKATRWPAPRRIKLHFMISVVASEPRDEHAILWRALAALMRTEDWPADLVPEAMRSLDVPVTSKVIQPDEKTSLLDVWHELGNRPRAALHYALTAPLDLDMALEFPLALVSTLRFRQPSQAPDREDTRIGGIVRGKGGDPLAGVTVAVAGRGAPADVTDLRGRYSLRGLEPGKVTLQVSPPDGKGKTVSVEVPSESYDIDLV